MLTTCRHVPRRFPARRGGWERCAAGLLALGAFACAQAAVCAADESRAARADSAVNAWASLIDTDPEQAEAGLWQIEVDYGDQRDAVAWARFRLAQLYFYQERFDDGAAALAPIWDELHADGSRDPDVRFWCGVMYAQNMSRRGMGDAGQIASVCSMVLDIHAAHEELRQDPGKDAACGWMHCLRAQADLERGQLEGVASDAAAARALGEASGDLGLVYWARHWAAAVQVHQGDRGAALALLDDSWTDRNAREKSLGLLRPASVDLDAWDAYGDLLLQWRDRFPPEVYAMEFAAYARSQAYRERTFDLVRAVAQCAQAAPLLSHVEDVSRLYTLWATLLLYMGKDAEADAVLDDMSNALAQDDPHAYRMALLHVAMWARYSRTSRALELIDDLLAEGTEGFPYQQGLLERARVLDLLGHTDEALASLTQLGALSPMLENEGAPVYEGKMMHAGLIEEHDGDRAAADALLEEVLDAEMVMPVVRARAFLQYVRQLEARGDHSRVDEVATRGLADLSPVFSVPRQELQDARNRARQAMSEGESSLLDGDPSTEEGQP